MMFISKKWKWNQMSMLPWTRELVVKWNSWENDLEMKKWIDISRKLKSNKYIFININKYQISMEEGYDEQFSWAVLNLRMDPVNRKEKKTPMTNPGFSCKR